MMCGSGRRHCTSNEKQPGHGVGHLRAAFRPHLVECQHMRCTCTWASQSCWGESPTNGCTSTAQSRLAEIGALELHEVGRWCSVHRHCLLSTTGRGWYCFHDGKSFMKVRQPLLCSLLTHSFLFLFTPHAHYPFGVFLSSCGWLAHWSGIAPTLFWRMRGTLS